jgi:hypothetical protein
MQPGELASLAWPAAPGSPTLESRLDDLLEQLPGVREAFLPALLQVWPERLQQAGRRRPNRPLRRSITAP